MRSFLPQLFPPQKKHLFHERFQKSKKNNWFLGVDPLPLQSVQLHYPQQKKQKREATDRWSPFWRDHFLKKLSSSNPSIFRCCIIVLGISVITLPPPPKPTQKKYPCSIHSPIFEKKAKPSPLLSTLPTLQPPRPTCNSWTGRRSALGSASLRAWCCWRAAGAGESCAQPGVRLVKGRFIGKGYTVILCYQLPVKVYYIKS